MSKYGFRASDDEKRILDDFWTGLRRTQERTYTESDAIVCEILREWLDAQDLQTAEVARDEPNLQWKVKTPRSHMSAAIDVATYAPLASLIYLELYFNYDVVYPIGDVIVGFSQWDRLRDVLTRGTGLPVAYRHAYHGTAKANWVTTLRVRFVAGWRELEQP